jgi:O-acetyl-ADP-ribose deacetylase (regulator of RNase III)
MIVTDLPIINRNILYINNGIIAHQVNCKGVMGAGLARQIKDKYPLVYTAYRTAYEAGELKPGVIQYCSISPHLYITNLCGQDGYGRDKQYTDYAALSQCLDKLYNLSQSLSLTPYIPYGIGCGLAGGKWKEVSQLIQSYCPNTILCKLN